VVISKKQHEANVQNAQKSTGPVTPEGKAAVRHNAITYGLRTNAILEWEDPRVYARLWEDFEADFQPQTRVEWCFLETMVTSQWLLARISGRERSIYEKNQITESFHRILASLQKQRVQLERSFRAAIADMKQSQKERQAKPQPEPVQQNATPPAEKTVASPPPAPSQPPVPPPAYVMSEATAIHPVVCAPAADDSR
jgi:hypothetical protein